MRQFYYQLSIHFDDGSVQTFHAAKITVDWSHLKIYASIKSRPTVIPLDHIRSYAFSIYG